MKRAIIEFLESRRLLTAGLPERSFGVGGLVQTRFGSTDGAENVTIDAAGRTVVCGFVQSKDLAQTVMVARYTASGTLDRSFGVRGAVISNFGLKVSSARKVVAEPDGRLLVLIGDSNSGHEYLIRLHGDGRLDSRFGVGGIVQLPIVTNDFCLAPDGAVIISQDHSLQRIRSNGKRDRSFGSAGQVSLFDPRFELIFIGSVAVNGRSIYASISTRTTETLDGGNGLVKFDLTGKIDSSYGEDGFAVSNEASDLGAVGAQPLVVEPDGSSFVAFGYFAPGVAKFAASGKLDTRFGDGGIVKVKAASLAVDSHGRIVMVDDAGFSETGTEVRRFLPNGSPDQIFSVDGIGGLPTPPNLGFQCSDIVLDASDNIIGAGAIGKLYAPTIHTAVGKINGGAGSPIVRFSNGVLSVNLPDGPDDLQIHSNGKSIILSLGVDAIAGSVAISKVKQIIVHGNGGKDRIGSEQLESTGPLTSLIVDGGDGNDNIYSRSTSDSYHESLYGGAGSDRIETHSPHALLDGGTGNDELLDDGGYSTVLGGAGDDNIASDNVLTDVLLPDTVSGGDGNDQANVDSKDRVDGVEVTY